MAVPKRRALVGLMGLMALLAGLAGCDSAAPWQRRGGMWHFDDQPLSGGGITELTVLNRRFAKTATQVFYREWSIDADAATFEALDEHHGRDARQVLHADTYRDSRDYFTTRRLRVRVLAGADPASFHVLSDGYARDRHQVFFEGEAFGAVDAAGFEVLPYGFARDHRRAWYLRTPVAGGDGASFAVIDAHHARDARHVFHADQDYSQPGPARVRVRRIAGADLSSFRALEAGYALDERRVYWRGEPIAGADPAHFHLLPPGDGDADAADQQRRYQRGRPLP